MPTIKAGELLQKLKKNGVNITRVDEISIARKNLGHDNFDATEMTAEEAALVEDHFAKNNPEASPPKLPKNGGKVAKKSHVDRSSQSGSMDAAIAKKNEALVQSGIVSGAQDAHIYNQGWQAGFVEQVIENTARNTAVIGRQINAKQIQGHENLVINASAVLGRLSTGEGGDDAEIVPLETDLDLFSQPAGLGFQN